MSSDYVAAEVAHSLRGLVACKSCKLVKNLDQFVKSGCENGCIPPSMGHERDAARREDVRSEVSADFDGLVSVFKPHESWVVRRLGMQTTYDNETVPCVPGVYAMHVFGIENDNEDEHEDDIEEDQPVGEDEGEVNDDVHGTDEL